MLGKLIPTAWLIAATLSGCAAAQPVLPAPPSEESATQDSQRALQSLFDEYVSAGKLPGIVAAIGEGDTAPVFISAGRISDDAEAALAGPDSLWRIYSMTKPVTAMAAMVLVEEGRLELDQPISDFIPAFEAMQVLEAPDDSLASRPARQAITVRHLLTHSSGLSYQFLGPMPLRQAYDRLGLLGGRADAAGRERQPSTLAEFADRVATLPLLAEPGTQWNYSVGIDILGRVIEVASGMPFDAFVQRRILDPLGMQSTYWTIPPSVAGRLATNYAWIKGQRVAIDPGASSDWLRPSSVSYGGSGLVSSARDYDRFLQMVAGQGTVDGVRILNRETVSLALSNLLPEGVRLQTAGTPDTTPAEGFGAGGWVYLADVPQGVRAGTYGWFGAAGTIAFLDPETGLRVTVMVNYFPANKWPLHRDIVRVLYRDFGQRSDQQPTK